MTDKQIIYYKKDCFNEQYCSLKEVIEELSRKTQECDAVEYDYQKQLENTNKWIAECENLQQQLDQLKVAKEQAEQKLKQIEKLCIKNSTKSSFCNGIENKDMQKFAIRILQIISEVK